MTGKLRLEDLQVIQLPEHDGATGFVAPATVGDVEQVLRGLGAQEAHAVPVLPGGPPRWLDAGGPGTYLILRLPVESPTPKEGE